MTHEDLTYTAVTVSVIGALAVALDFSPLSRTRFVKTYVYGGVTRRASRLLSVAVLALGLLGLIVALVWGLFL
jgi:hypothetical protein